MLKLNPGLLALISTLTIAGCRGDDPGTSEASTGGSSTGAPVTTTDTPTTTDGTTTTGVDGTTSGTTGTPTTAPEPDSSTGDNSGSFLTTNTDTGSEESGGALPDGSACEADADCVSMNCTDLLLGMVKFCGECNADQDCVDAGTGTACTYSIPNQNSSCTDGPPGSTCESTEACMGDQFCESALDTPILPNTCGECAESADCDPGLICTPTADLTMLTGKKACVEPGSVPNNELCPGNAEGNDACMSMHCTDASLLGFITLHICGECAADADCDMGQTCKPAEASMTGFSGSICE